VLPCDKIRKNDIRELLLGSENSGSNFMFLTKFKCSATGEPLMETDLVEILERIPSLHEVFFNLGFGSNTMAKIEAKFPCVTLVGAVLEE
jgi:hypothetical protein